MDWLDLLALQGTLKSLLQPHSSKAPILQLSAFFIERVYIHYIYMYVIYDICSLGQEDLTEKGMATHSSICLSLPDLFT